jgi:hypothetical protein
MPFTALPDQITECVNRLAEAWTVYERLGGLAPAAVHALVV